MKKQSKSKSDKTIKKAKKPLEQQIKDILLVGMLAHEKKTDE